MQKRSILRSSALSLTLAAAVAVSTAAPAVAQSNPGWFVPPAGGNAPPRPPAAAPRPQPRPAVPTAPLVPPSLPQQPGQQTEAELPPPAPVALPPMPDLPQLPRGAAPPASVIGVLSVPDIMRTSMAAQQIEKVITERREKLNQDAQAEQVAWRELQQQLANSRAGSSAEQIRSKERELQDRITNAQKQFRDRNRIIQETLQFGLGQIEQVLSAVVRQVSESRGMNLVLHRAQVVLNVAEFDMTEQVATQLNKALPQVALPPDGVAPSTFSPPRPVAAAPGTVPGAAPGTAPAAVPAAAPVPPAAAPAPPRR